MVQHKPPRTQGLRHLFAATGYSAAGLRRLGQEAAFRQEALGGAIALIALWLTGASAMALGIMAILLLLLLAVEALNTAIEVVVDHLSPDWSVFAKDAKDVGSTAVFLMICANLVWFLLVFFGFAL
jgi:diacylglycerol kinase (ATP)